MSKNNYNSNPKAQANELCDSNVRSGKAAGINRAQNCCWQHWQCGGVVRLDDLCVVRGVLFHTILSKNDETASLLATFAIFAVGFFMRPIGGWALGIYSDRYGRKSALGSPSC
ncbi:hypothetical protein NWF32_21865 [Pseudomonas qingdaonensis]|nr:hypothetical protein [Pseudomonas qingdaonensis]